MINDTKDGVKWRALEGSVMGSKRLTPTRVGKMASKCLLLLLYLLSCKLLTDSTANWHRPPRAIALEILLVPCDL